MGRKENRVLVYTDGSCFGNPGKGGYAAIVRSGDAQWTITGSVPFSTNNRMELTAVIEGLSSVACGSAVTVLTDSQYVEKAVNDGYLDIWRQNGWRRIRTGDPVKNADKWLVLANTIRNKDLHVIFVKLKAHKTNAFNNHVDLLARQAAQNQTGRTIHCFRILKP